MCLAFFLIVPSVIVVTIFLVHSIAQKIGFKVRYFSLILCAVMSLVVNFAAIELSTYLDKWHYIRLGILIFIASLIVTLTNRYLIKHDKSDVKIIIDDAEFEEELALEEETTENSFSKTVEVKTNETVEPFKTITKKPITQPEIKVLEEKSSETIVTKTNFPILLKTKSSETTVKTTILPKIKSTETSVKKSTLSTLSNVKSSDTVVLKTKLPEQDKKVVPKNKDNKEDKKFPIITKKKSDATVPQPIPKVTKADKIEDKPKNTKSVNTKPIDTKPVKPTTVDKIADINAHLGSLDDILDYAYAQKSKGDLNQAVLAYQKALDRYKNDDYAPFIAIDLGNIYKEQAAYMKFIKTYEEALKLPVVLRNSETRKEFNKNLAYMRIVQSVLIKHRALTMPFSKIPRQYLQEIETEFKSLQLNKRGL